MDSQRTFTVFFVLLSPRSSIIIVVKLGIRNKHVCCLGLLLCKFTCYVAREELKKKTLGMSPSSNYLDKTP